MSTSISNFNWKGLVFSIASLIALILIYCVITRKKISPISGDTLLFFILFALGLTMSIFSGSRFLAFGSGHFPDIVTTTLKSLGFFSFAMLFMTPLFTGIGLRIPLVYGYSQGLLTLSVVIAVKWILVRLFDIIMLFSKQIL